jgi:phage baseplate assembly protein W
MTVQDPDVKYARDVSFPLRFDEDCDLFLDENEAIIDQSIQLIAFTNKGNVILTEDFGSSINLSVFDPLDTETELIIDTSLRQAFEANEPRVFLDKEFVFDESADESTLIIMVPYRIKVNGKLAASRIITDRPLNG